MGERRAARVCRRGVDALLSVTLAARCAGCARVLDTPLDGPVCAQCWASLTSRLLPHLALPHLTTPAGHAIDAGRAAADYEGVVRDIIHAFKYEGRRTLARPLGALLRDAGVDLLAGSACAVPVPLHPWRRMRRGFNQAADLAAQLGLPVVHALWRVRSTPAQMALSADDRQRNVRGAFRIAPWMTPRTLARCINDQVVVLVDDVTTTGATLEACAAALKAAGAREVRALTVALTPRALR